MMYASKVICCFCTLLITFGDAHLHYPNNPFFNQIINNVWQNQQAINNQNALMQQQLQNMFANSQMAFNNQLATSFNNFPGFHPANQDFGSRPSPVRHYNPFFNYDNDGNLIPSAVIKPVEIENATPMPIPVRPPYINPVDTSVTFSSTQPDEQIETTEPSYTTEEDLTPIYIDGVPVIPLTKNDIRR